MDDDNDTQTWEQTSKQSLPVERERERESGVGSYLVC